MTYVTDVISDFTIHTLPEAQELAYERLKLLDAQEIEFTVDVPATAEWIKNWLSNPVRREVKFVMQDSYRFPWNVRKGKKIDIDIDVDGKSTVTINGRVTSRRKNVLTVEGDWTWRVNLG